MKLFWKIILILLALGALDVGRYFIYPNIAALKNERGLFNQIILINKNKNVRWKV